jgi:hypothetical protein
MNARLVDDARRTLAEPASPEPFEPWEVAGLPDPVRRYFFGAVAPGTRLARSAELEMRGHIKLGRWLPFRARQVLNPHRGFIWAARAAGVISGWDRYIDGAGAMEWKLGGVVTVMRAHGPDVTRSAAGRGAAEILWLPTAALPRFGVTWTAESEEAVVCHHSLGATEVDVRHRLDDDGHITSTVFERWGDPDGTGQWAPYPFGGEITSYGTFEGLSIPAAGRFGWHFGTERWSAGEFFRYEITELRVFI